MTTEVVHYLDARFLVPLDEDPAVLKELDDQLFDRPLVNYICRYIAESSRESNDVIDVGAHIGLYSILAAKRGARVLALEPDGQTTELLKKNVHLNQVANRVVIKTLAVGQHVQEVHWDDSPPPCARRVLASNSSNSKQRISMTTVDALVSELNIQPAVIKIDAEGLDFDVLCGARKTIQKYNPLVLVELHPRALKLHGRTADNILEFARFAKHVEVLLHRCSGPLVPLQSAHKTIAEQGGNLLLSQWEVT